MKGLKPRKLEMHMNVNMIIGVGCYNVVQNRSFKVFRRKIMRLMWDTSIENWMDNVLRIGSLDFVNMKIFNHGYNFNKNEYFYWINLGRFKIRWWRNTVQTKCSGEELTDEEIFDNEMESRSEKY